MKKLLVLRHAKSSWDGAFQTDFERPLNKRGERAAPVMGEFMKMRLLAPDFIVSSPAARAKATAEKVKRAAEFSAPLHFDQRIYEASASDLLQVLMETPDESVCAMIVGHNPGLENLISVLTGEIQAMPTAALAEIDLNIVSWREIQPGCGNLLNLFKPKEIAD